LALAHNRASPMHVPLGGMQILMTTHAPDGPRFRTRARQQCVGACGRRGGENWRLWRTESNVALHSGRVGGVRRSPFADSDDEWQQEFCSLWAQRGLFQVDS